MGLRNGFVVTQVLLAVSSVPVHEFARSPARVHIVAPNPQAEGWASLFAPETRTQLKKALDGVGVFKVMINCVTNRFGYCAETDWGQVAGTLRHLNVSLGIEAGMFQGLHNKELPNSCNGTADALDDLAKIENLLRAGGTPALWTMDSVFQHTFPYPLNWPGWKHQHATDCCNFTIEDAAAQGAAYARMIRKRLPGVAIGLNEPVPWYTVTAENGTVYPAMTGHPIDYDTGRDLPSVILALNTALMQIGEAPLEYFHADQPLEYSIGELNDGGNAYPKLGALQNVVHTPTYPPMHPLTHTSIHPLTHPSIRPLIHPPP